MRLDPALDIRPYQGAQGFRVGPDHRKIRARLTDAEMFHYGWARPAQALREKRELGKTMYPWRDADERLPAARLGAGHPALRAARIPRPPPNWIEARRIDPERVIAPAAFRWRFLRYYISGAIERLTGSAGLRVPQLHAGLRLGRSSYSRPARSSSSRWA